MTDPTPRGSASTAAVVLIGDELLSGKIQEENLIELARALRANGVAIRRVVMVPDDIATIAAEIRHASDNHDVVFTSGGVGPTHDDVTLEAVAAAFGERAVEHPSLVKMFREALGERCTDAHLRMALAPESARLVTSNSVRWPTVVMRNVWVLPGVPEVFRMKLAVVREHVVGPSPFLSRAVFTNMDESALKPLLDAVVAGHTHVSLGSYPKFSDPLYKTKVTFDGTEATLLDAALDDFVGRLPPGEPQRVD